MDRPALQFSRSPAGHRVTARLIICLGQPGAGMPKPGSAALRNVTAAPRHALEVEMAHWLLDDGEDLPAHCQVEAKTMAEWEMSPCAVAPTDPAGGIAGNRRQRPTAMAQPSGLI